MADFAQGTVNAPALMNIVGGVRKDTPGDLATANAHLEPIQFDATGNVRVTEEGGSPTYLATSEFSSDATGTDIAIFPGNAATTCILLGITISSSATAAAEGLLQIIRRSAADTGGTSANASVATADARDAANSTTPKHYTAHPTALGASAGVIWAQRFIQVATSGTLLLPFSVNFASWLFGSKAIRVSGVSDIIAINIPAGLGGSGNNWTITWIWKEIPTTG